MLADGGSTLLGENRAQDLVEKAARIRAPFTWDFIGHLQSRKVRQILPHVRYIHSVASDSALAQFAATATPHRGPGRGQRGRRGGQERDRARGPGRIPGALAGEGRWADDDAAARRRPRTTAAHFAALRELAREHRLPQLSMGTSQDYSSR